MIHSPQDLATTSHDRSIGIWLLVCCIAIFGMVVLGGVTRLTGSGLSMVEWRPILGIWPPLNLDQWQEVFQLYQQSPEYQKINYRMDLDGFKSIFWFEYTHRLLGRAIGIIFLLPLIYFMIRGRVRKPLIPRLVAMFILGGLQGLMGWYMVQSGLINNPHVSQYRLTAHLGLALIIYAYLFWLALDLLGLKDSSAVTNAPRGLRVFSLLLSGLVFVTALSGGFVAGLKAGLAYNTFPLMAGRLIPEGLLSLDPAWINFFENVTTVQFDHRVLATLVFLAVIGFWWAAKGSALSSRVRIGLHLLLVALLLQVTLGILTLLHHVPVTLGAAHQGGALVLLTCMLFVTHQLQLPKRVVA